jgi:hypothetical protein
MKWQYSREVVPRLEELRPAMKVGDIGHFSDGRRDYAIHYVMAESPNPRAKKVFLSAGIHGDEKAGVYALLDFLRKDVKGYLNHYSFVALPCLNPSGFERDTRSNHNRRNINRDFKTRSRTKEARSVKSFMRMLGWSYLFCLNSHEDPTHIKVKKHSLEDNPREFYLYLVSPLRDIGHTIMNMMEENDIEVCKRERIYEDRADSGVVWWAGRHDPEYCEYDTLENHFLNYTEHSIAPETPTCWSLEKRILAHRLTIAATIEHVGKYGA